MHPAILLPLLGAALHPILGWAIQSATKREVGLLLLVALNNLLTVVVVLSYRIPEGSFHLSSHDWLAVANGVLFFFGQWFSAQSVRRGHLAVHSSALGAKIIIVAIFSIGFGLEVGRPFLLLAVVLAACALFLVAGGNLQGWREHRKTVGLTLIACVFFGINDFLTGFHGSTVGTARWLTLMLGTAGLMSLFLLASRARQLRSLLTTRGAAKWFVLLAGTMLGLQTVLVNIAFSEYGQPTLSNVAYSTRGVMAVIWLLIFGGIAGKDQWRRRTLGSLLMIAALWLAMQ